jgi:class 3 adenylate cyclase
MRARLTAAIDHFLFAMTDGERALLLLRIFFALTAIYAGTLLTALTVFPQSVYSPQPVYREYLALNLAGAAASFVLLLALRKRRAPPWLPALVAALTGAQSLTMIHWVGSINSTAIMMVPTLVAVAVPFFGRHAAPFSFTLVAAMIALILLEASGVASYNPLRVNMTERDLLGWGNVFISIGWIVVLTALVFVFAARLYARLQEAHEALGKERAKSEALLANVLPRKIIAELKEAGETAPEVFENVSVYFSDIVGFTVASTQLSPDRLIAELTDLFGHFDAIMDAHGCERIKTIGDAYLAVAGMDGRADHAEALVQAASAIVGYLAERNRTSELRWHIRVGVHSGSIVGGIVGKRRYLYDVFGDTVNTASRMESCSEPMRINVSAATARLLAGKVALEDRGESMVKGKGLMRMYFVGEAPRV